jgi:hypothetical protein
MSLTAFSSTLNGRPFLHVSVGWSLRSVVHSAYPEDFPDRIVTVFNLRAMFNEWRFFSFPQYVLQHTSQSGKFKRYVYLS